jgi:hypothetical protein
MMRGVLLSVLWLVPAFLVGCDRGSAGGNMSAKPQKGVTKEEPVQQLDPANFDDSAKIDNEWFPLKPGTKFVWEGTSVDEEGDEEDHRVVFIVTDLTKVIGGVKTLVCWDADYIDNELEESELIFFAQDKNGNVWQLGEYPQEYDNLKIENTPCWIHGAKGSKAGIAMLADPKVGGPSYAQGWAPSVNWTDRGVVDATDEKVKVPAGSYEGVLVIDEYNSEEPNAHQLKYYARGVGNVRVGWRGDDASREELELISVEHLSDEELAKAREEALKLEKNAYELCKDVYGNTEPSVPLRQLEQSGATGQ